MNELALPPLEPAVLAKLRVGAHHARGTMAAETGRALCRAFGAFQHWCADQGMAPLPASPDLVAAYVDHLAAIAGRKAAGIRQAVWAIGTMHRLSQSADPTKAEPVRQALKRMSRELGTRQSQAAPIGTYEVRRIIETSGTRPADLRNLALVLVMRDMLARRSEVVALDVADISYDRDGSATAMVGRSKTDQTSEGAELYLSPRTITHLKGWLEVAGIAEGAIFRAVNKTGRIGTRLEGNEVARLIKRVAERAGMAPDTVARVSGHSCRVGMTQDLVASGADVAGVMQAGRWKSPLMPARYSARLQAKRGAVARLYERQEAL